LVYNTRIEKKHPGTHFFSCVDSRSEYAVLGTPGGDVGELIMAFGAAEYLNPLHKFSLGEVNELVQEFLHRMKAMGKEYLYMHTDEAAESALKEAAGVKSIKNPASADERNTLLGMVSNPEYIGCTHLKAMIEDSASYHVRKELVEHVIKVFHNVLYDNWNPLRHRLLYVTLKGEASKGPGMKVFTPHVCKSHEAPLVVPNTGKSKAWVYHHKHVTYFRNIAAAFLVLHDTNLNMKLMADRMTFMASEHDKQLEANYGSPAYDLIFA